MDSKCFINYKKLIFCVLAIIGNLLLCYYFLKNLSIPFDKLSKICFIFLSVLSSVYLNSSWTVLKKYISVKSVLGVIVLTMYTGFSLTGNYLWVYPLDKSWNFDSIKLYTSICIWLMPLIVLLISFFIRINSDAIYDSYCVKKTNRILWIPTLLFLAAGCIYLIAYNPAITSEDTYTQFFQALGRTPLVNWHPPFHTLMIRFLLSICNSPLFVACAQYIFCVLIFVHALNFINSFHYQAEDYRRWLYILGFTLFLVLSPNHILTMITLWKDIPYAFTILWLTILTARLLLDTQSCIKSNIFFLECIFSLVCVFLLRQNGFIVYIITVIGWLFIVKGNRKLIFIFITSVLLIFTFNIITNKGLNVEKGPDGGEFLGLGHDIVGVYHSGGELTPDALKIAEYLDTGDYSPYEIYGKANFGLDIPVYQFVVSYISTFLKNPVLMTKVILCRMDLSWDIVTGNGGMIGAAGYRETVNKIKEWDNLYPNRKVNILTEVLDRYIDKTVITSMSYIFWRAGIWLVLVLASCYAWVLLKQSKMILILLPCFSQMLSLILSTSWPDYRYFYPLVLSLQFFLGLSIINMSRLKGKRWL